MGGSAHFPSHAQQCGWVRQSSGTSHWLHTRWERSRNRRLSKNTSNNTAGRLRALLLCEANAGVRETLTKRDGEGQDEETESLLCFQRQSIKQGCTHTHTRTQTDIETWKHLKCHLIAARQTQSERAQQDIDILYTHTQHGEALGSSLCDSQFYTPC